MRHWILTKSDDAGPELGGFDNPKPRKLSSAISSSEKGSDMTNGSATDSLRMQGQIDHDDDSDENESKKKSKQGWFMGVYCPVLANILGIILFLRMPQVIGETGILQCFIIIAMCSSATTLTTLSMSAIATNGKIKSGGSYYMISRSLGPATGGAVGILFYFATTLSGAMYIIGQVEALIVVTGI